MAEPLDELEIKISSSSTDAVKRVNELTSALERLKKSASGVYEKSSKSDIQNVGKDADKSVKLSKKTVEQIEALSRATQAINSKAGHGMKELAGGLRALAGVREVKIPKSLADNIVNLAAAIDLIDERIADKAAKFAASLKALSDAGKINVSSKLPDRLLDIGAAMDLISDDAIRRLDSMTASLQRLSGVDLKGLPAALREVSKSKGPTDLDMAKVDASIEKTKETIADLQSRYEALQAVQGKGSADTQARNAAELAKVSALLREQETRYDSLIEKKKKYAESGVGRDENLSGTGEVQTREVEEVTERVGVLQRALDAVRQGWALFDVEAVKATKEGTAELEKMKKSISDSLSSFSSFGKAASSAFESLKERIAAAAVQSEKFAKILKIGLPIIGALGAAFRGVVSLAGKLWSVAKRIGSAFVSLAKTIAGAVVGAVKKFASLVRSAAVSVTKMLGSGLAKGLKVVGTGLKAIGSGVLNYVTNPFKKAINFIQNWKKKLLSVAFYRAVRTALKMVTDGLKEGMENLYLFSQQANTQFAPAMDSLAASGLYLKNSLGAMAAPLIQAVAPVVETLINMFVDLLNVINAAFAAMTGQSSYTKALYNAATWGDDLSDAMGGAAESAKEFKRYLIGIDELNVIPEQSEPGGGGGGGGSGLDYENYFEVAEVPSELTDLAKKIKDAIAAGDWYGAGQILAEKLNSIIDNFDADAWGTKIGEKVQGGLEFFIGLVDNLDIEGFGGKIATLLSNALNEIDGETLGAAMAEGIKAAFRFVEGFVAEYKGPNIGTYLADIVNGWFEKMGELDENGESGWTRAGKLVNNGIKSIIDGATEFIGGLDTETISRSLNDFFAEIKWGDIAKNVRVLFETASEKDWEGVGAAIGGKIGEALRNIDPNDIAVPIAGVFKAGIKLLSGVVEGYDGPSIGAYLADVVNGWFEDLSTLDENGESAFTRAGKIVNEGINGLITGITEFIGGLNDETITTAMKQFFGQIKWSEIWDNLIELGETAADKKIWKNMLTSLWNAIGNIAVWFREEILGISSEEARKPWDELETKLETASDEVTWLDALQSLALLFGDIATTLINMIPDEDLGSVWEALKQKLATSLGTTDWEDLKSKLWESVGSVMESLVDELGSLLYEKMNASGGIWSTIADVIFPTTSAVDALKEAYDDYSIEDTIKYFENGLNGAGEFPFDENSVLAYLKERTGFEYDSIKEYKEAAEKGILDLLGHGGGGKAGTFGGDRAKAEITIDVEAVVNDINTSNIPEEKKSVYVKAIANALDSDKLSPEFKKIVVDATIGTVNRDDLTPDQKSIVMDAIVKTLDSTQLPEKNKSLIMTALLHAVDGTGLNPEEKQLLMDAKLDSVIDALKPQDKEVGGIVGNVGELRAPPHRLTIDASARVTDAEDKIPPERKIISGGFKGTSFTNGLKSNPVIEAVSKFASSIWSLTKEQRTNTAWAQFVSSIWSLTKEQRTNTAWAQFTASIWSLTKEQQTNTAWAQFISSIWSLTKEQRTNTAWAQFTASIWSLTKEQRTNAVWAKFASSIWSLTDKQRTADVIAKATTFENAIKSPEITVKAKISEIVSSAASKVKSWLGLATGGIYKNGRWEPIAGYAAGGSPRSARLFYANENGMPELVGRIGSSTAVMNNGQIVASVASGVYQAVSAAMGSVGGYFASIANGLSRIPAALSSIEPAEISPVRVWESEPSYAQVDVTSRNDPRYGGADGMEASIRESNEDMINALYAVCQRVVTAINEKDTRVVLDRQEVGRSVTREQNRMTTMYGKRMVEA